MSTLSAKNKGLLITFEGCEGGGKTTQVDLLQERFTKEGRDVIVLREPGGTDISEQIREVVLSTKNTDMDFTTEVLLFQAARAQTYGEIVLPNLEAGKVVLMDRSRDSSVIYQGLVRGFGEKMIEDLNNISTKNTYPDMTVLLDLKAEIGLKRRTESGKIDRLDLENIDFHHQVRKEYFKFAKKDLISGKENSKGRWAIVDASQNIEEVEKAIWQLVEKKLLSN